MFVPSLKEKSIEKVKNDGYYTHQTMNDTIDMVFDKQNVPMCTQLTRLKTITESLFNFLKKSMMIQKACGSINRANFI